MGDTQGASGNDKFHFYPLTPLPVCYPDYMAFEKLCRDAVALSAETPSLEKIRIALQDLPKGIGERSRYNDPNKL